MKNWLEEVFRKKWVRKKELDNRRGKLEPHLAIWGVCTTIRLSKK